MEYLDGQILADRLQMGAVPIEQALKIGMEIAAGRAARSAYIPRRERS